MVHRTVWHSTVPLCRPLLFLYPNLGYLHEIYICNKENFIKKKRALATASTSLCPPSVNGKRHHDIWRRRQDYVTAEPDAPCSKLSS